MARVISQSAVQGMFSYKNVQGHNFGNRSVALIFLVTTDTEIHHSTFNHQWNYNTGNRQSDYQELEQLKEVSRTHSRQNKVVEQRVTKSLKNTAVDILVKCSFQSWLVCKINYCLLFFVYFNTTTSLKLFYYKPDYLQNVVQFTLFFQSFLKITLFFQSLKWCLYDFWSYFALAK